MLTPFAANLLFPQVLELQQVVQAIVAPRRLYRRSHISHLRHDRFRKIMDHGSPFTVFVKGANPSGRSTPLRAF